MAKVKTTMTKFVSSSIACETFGCSEQHLKNLQTYWKYGHHYIDLRLPDSNRAAYRYSLDRLSEWFNTAPEMRG